MVGPDKLDNKRPLLWRELAKQIPGRSNKDCRKRWWNSLAGSTAKGAWSPEEDRRLIEAVEKYGTNWMKVAGAVGTRCGDQCSGHWRHVLNPNINYCDWTTEEDDQLLEAVRVYGTNWSTIASFHTPQRTTLALKNQYWKLRQRSQNTSKTSSPKPSSSASSDTASTTATEKPKTANTNRTSCSSADEAEGDEDDDEDVEMDLRNDESETEWPDVDMNHADEYGQADPTWLGDWTEESAPQQRLVSPKHPVPLAPLWTGHHAEVPSTGRETWMEGLAEPGMSGDSSTSSLYSKDSFFGPAPHEGGEQSANMAFEGQGQPPQRAADDETQNLYFADLDDILQQYNPVVGGNLAGPVPVTTGTFPTTTVDMLNPVSPGNPGCKDISIVTALPVDPALGTSTGDASPPSKAAESLSHSVSIKFSCTTGQLSNIMSLLASTGLPVNMKIDTE
ncbi:Myb-related protein B [Cytospora mali]|uniref:Myb-related protein B n=1 Tax=Cytospora mali TaxID=578113 RepID=A0A194UMU9_CYTMA|nr:Myb-related protein B [Valsa mali var. pyri (nom. inval.)]